MVKEKIYFSSRNTITNKLGFRDRSQAIKRPKRNELRGLFWVRHQITAYRISAMG